MLACLINGQGDAEMREVPSPRLQPGEVLIKLASAGICGTDIEKVHGAYGLGGILGHEVSGTIASLGEGVTDLRKSDRVIAHHHVPCYNCHYCQQDRKSTRLNSSHVSISYAVFCLKKKK